MLTIGIDVGGTFTDLAGIDEAGRTSIAKAASTPHDPSDGVLEGLSLLAQGLGLDLPGLLAATSRIVHGTTVATNALLEGKGARVGMLTTEGHRDIIEMREGLKPERYNLRLPPSPALVPRGLRIGVRERLRADGSVEIALDPASLDAALDLLAADGVQGVAICFLHAWRNPAHEQLAAAAARARLPGVFVTTSSDVLPQIKEYERFSTTVANALVGPIVQTYLGRLETRLAAAGYAGPLFIMLSHGGVATVAEAGLLAAGTALSGPAGGVAALTALARQGAGAYLVGFDMGGTSTDIALIRAGAAFLSSARGVGEARIALPSLDITTLGAGGGSIAHLGADGMLHVGPRSAGAAPGPACYGTDGSEPTVTDANLALGYLDPANFLGGRRHLDVGAAQAALHRLGTTLGLNPVETAAGIHRLVNARMADGIRVATVRRGIDPRRFALLGFGGAAGLHATAVAAALGMRRVVVPVQAAVLSAWGMLNTDLRVELVRSLSQSGAPDIAQAADAVQAMQAEGNARLRWFDGELRSAITADMRYGEQVSDIQVAVDPAWLTAPDGAERLAAAFHDRHAALYTYALPDRMPVLVNIRVTVTGGMPPVPATSNLPTPAPVGRRNVYLGDWQEVAVHRLDALDRPITGPALIESETTTILLRTGDVARPDPRGWLGIDLPD